MQGSVLGGLLFVIFINDIDSCVSSFLRKFADDTKLARVVVNEDDRNQFQQDLESMHRWAQKWGMNFNVAKCKIMHVGSSNQKHEYLMNGTKLEVVSSERNLGIIVENNLKPATQCEAAAKKANCILGQIARSFHYRTKGVLVNVYKTFVRPHLEGAACAWSPWFAKDKGFGGYSETVHKDVVRR